LLGCAERTTQRGGGPLRDLESLIELPAIGANDERDRLRQLGDRRDQLTQVVPQRHVVTRVAANEIARACTARHRPQLGCARHAIERADRANDRVVLLRARLEAEPMRRGA
jgi:hypothetical protein